MHGAHSSDFCNHAHSPLADMVAAYHERGFAWVGLTEHIPVPEERFLFPEERAAGITLAAMYDRFRRYSAAARKLQREYAGRMRILVGFETEAFSGYAPWIEKLRAEFKPDYIVGSVHHIDDICYDGLAESYQHALAELGSHTALYCRYFDRQFEMLTALRPEVVGHFDLIRIFDSDYRLRWADPAIRERITRNLRLIKELDLILDFNLRALLKGAKEPYISRPILLEARELGISVVPSDDSHSVAEVGANMAEGIRILHELGFDTHWRVPGGRH